MNVIVGYQMQSADESLPSHVLDTGATGFAGPHVVDLLLEHEIKVTGTGRSPVKASEMKTRREEHGDLFSMAVTGISPP